jgi:hypothetical protein
MSAFQPHPLRERPRPPHVADTVNPEMDYATTFVENVYRDLPGVESGAVKYLRISQRLFLPAPVRKDGQSYDHNHLHFLPGDATGYHFAHWTWAPTRTIGIVPVKEDGSAFFKVPAGTPVFLQALDENFCEVRRMRSSFTLQRGEFRGCMGCHESRLEVVGTRPIYPEETLKHGPATPEPPSWGDTVALDFREHVQPIFEKHCVSCHGQDNPAGNLELTSREIGGFTQSYRALFGLKPEDPTPVVELDWHKALHPEAADADYIDEKRAARDIAKQMQANTWPGQLVSISDRHSDASITQPYQFGSNKSKLIRTLLDEPEHAKIRRKMTEDEWLRLVTWVDYNAVYHSTVIDVRRFKEDGSLPRVKYDLPSPWKPGDTNPTFYNTYDGHLADQTDD